MTEVEKQILDIFEKLNKEDQQTVLNMTFLIAVFPGFEGAVKRATPAGENVPPWNVTEQLVSAWMELVGDVYTAACKDGKEIKPTDLPRHISERMEGRA